MTQMTYPMKAACLLTELPADTLRAWERRYKAVEPKHTSGGRQYSQGDINRLKLLKWAVDHGHRISQVATLGDADLEELRDRMKPRRAAASTETRPEVSQLVTMIKEFSVDADLELGRLASLMPPREFVYQIVLPLLRTIGREWEAGELSIAQEHLTSAAVRNVLGTLVRIYGVNNRAPSLVFCTLPEDQHEFGILTAAMLTVVHRLRALYFGPNMPIDDIATAAEKGRARAIVLGVSYVHNHVPLGYKIEQLRRTTDDRIDIIVGGYFDQQLIEASAGTRVEFAENMEAFEYLLPRYGADLVP